MLPTKLATGTATAHHGCPYLNVEALTALKPDERLTRHESENFRLVVLTATDTTNVTLIYKAYPPILGRV
jgi:hypothetical protein